MTPKGSATPSSDQEDAVVVVESIYCPECGYEQDNPTIVLESIRTKNDGWKATGSVHCPECGMALRSIKKKIPIVAANFKCPTCNKKSKLKYRVTKIKQKDATKPHEFEFQVDISCSKLTHKFSYKKIIDSILNVMSINVGPEGVKISKSE
jgi:DNA-directed RNA polymerase subunit M/transcription elongation factor TFIIS